MGLIPWVGQSATARSSNVDALRLVNAFPEVVESKQGKAVIALYGRPGLATWVTFDPPVNGVWRGHGLFLADNGRFFGVLGDQVWEVDALGNKTLRGLLSTRSGPVSIDENGADLMIVDGAKAYFLVYSTNNFIQGGEPQAYGTHCAFLDGYLITNEPGTGRFHWSNLYTVSFDPLSVATAEGAPDALRALIVIHRELWLLGARTTEVWTSTGAADNPFQRVPGAFLHQGIAAPHSVSRVGETLCWLAENDEGQRIVVQAQGYQLQRISSHPVETALASYVQITDALGWSEQREGHIWYVLTFPGANATWVYDQTVGLWHEVGGYDPHTGFMGRHRAANHVYAFGEHLYGDYSQPLLYRSRMDVYDDAGQPLVRQATLPPIFSADDRYRVQLHRLQIDCETGVGRDGNQDPGLDPQMTLALSRDGGHTFGNERSRSLGPIGKTRARVFWTRCGAAWDIRARITVSAPVKLAIVGAVAEVEGSTS